MNKIEVVEAKDLRDGRDFKVSVDRPFRDDEYYCDMGQGWYRRSKTIKEGTTVLHFLESILTDRYGTLTMGDWGEIRIKIVYDTDKFGNTTDLDIPLITYGTSYQDRHHNPIIKNRKTLYTYLERVVEPLLDHYELYGLLYQRITDAKWEGYNHTNGICTIEDGYRYKEACEKLPEEFKEWKEKRSPYVWFGKL
jgi:hypothetical protein